LAIVYLKAGRDKMEVEENMTTKRSMAIPPDEPSLLTVPRAEARERINAQIAKGTEILNQQINSEADVDLLNSNYRRWNDFNTELLRVLFSGKRILEDYDRHRLVSFQMGGGPREQIRVYREYTRRAIAELESLEERLDLISENQNREDATKGPDLPALIRILRGFHRVTRQLRFRRENRPTLEIHDEYDVQDLLHALLKIDFDDVRPEEWTPSYAGKSSRTDFLLKNEKIVVETKKTKTVNSARNIGDELIIDISRYRGHPDCKTLVCFIYDPEGYVQNPEGLISDLERNSDSLNIRVIIEPSPLTPYQSKRSKSITEELCTERIILRLFQTPSPVGRGRGYNRPDQRMRP